MRKPGELTLLLEIERARSRGRSTPTMFRLAEEYIRETRERVEWLILVVEALGEAMEGGAR